MNMEIFHLRGNLTASTSYNKLLLSLEVVQHVLTEVECIGNDLFRRGRDPLTKSHIY